jgi:outer membrane protein
LIFCVNMIVGTCHGIFIISRPSLNAQQDSAWSLQKCIDYAFTRNIQIRKSEISNQRSGLYSEQAKAQRMPSLNGSFNENFTWSKNPLTGQTQLTGASGSNFSMNSGVTLYNASKINNQIKQAGLEIEAGKYSLETIKESISLSILNAYLQVLYAEEQVKNSQKQIESTTGQLNLASERLALKSISISDYAQVKSQMASEKLTLANSESQLSIAKINLMQLMELPVQENFIVAHPDIDEALNQRRLPDSRSVYETALAIKPQVKNAEVNKQIASLDERIAKASYFPLLSANAGISSGYSSTATDPYFSQLNSGLRPAAGISLSIPIYQKKQVKTSIAVAKLGYQDAELSETDTKNQLRKNIEQACLDVFSAQIEYEASIEKYQATQESSALSDEKFRQGIINSVDYLVTKTNMIVAESQLLQSKYNLIFSYKILDFYMGIPLSL